MVRPRVLGTIPDFPVRLERSVAAGGWGDAPLVPAPVQVRVDGAGAVWATNGHERIVHCGDSAGIELPGGSGPLRDFAFGTGHGLLFADGLRWSSGWWRDGDFDAILADATRLLLSQRHGPAVSELDAGTGELRRTLLRSPDAGRPFLAGGRICSVFTDVEAGRRGIEVIDAAGTVDRTALPGPDHYAALVHTVGFDGDLRGYAVSDGTVTRFSRSGELEPLASVPVDVPPAAFHVDASGRLLYAIAAADTLTVFCVQ